MATTYSTFLCVIKHNFCPQTLKANIKAPTTQDVVTNIKPFFKSTLDTFLVSISHNPYTK